MSRMAGWLSVVAFVLIASASAQAQQTVGLFQNDAASYDGYTLFAPLRSRTTYLVNNEGKHVHSWSSSYTPGNSVYLLENGNLLRTAEYTPGGVPRFNVGGQGGRVEEFLWNGASTWDFVYSDLVKRQHHDIERLPNGNVLMIAWEYKSSTETIAAGRSPALLSEGELWPDHIIEVQPTGASSGDIVWEWHVWDHLIQDFNPTKDNYGTVSDHPELVNVNFVALTGPNAGKADWNHVNGIDYNAELDQIVISVHAFSEIWILDHSTTTVEAAGHSGGNSGKGGDLLYRWGNPQAYDRGMAADQTLFKQHDARWIESGSPGEGNLLIFNNGTGRPAGNYSSVDEIVAPLDEQGEYFLASGSAYGPSSPTWSYSSVPTSDFYGQNISGAERLPNGNTLVCSGPQGIFFEVTPAKETVWRYVNPINGAGAISQGGPAVQTSVFRAWRYAPDYPAFDGKNLTPGDPLEQYDRPLPVPDGEGVTDALICDRVTGEGDWIRVDWDSSNCPADTYNLLYGNLADLSGHVLQGAECGIGVFGRYDWRNVPAGDLYFLIVGVDSTGVYESSWGTGNPGEERSPGSSSWRCGTTTKDATLTCP